MRKSIITILLVAMMLPVSAISDDFTAHEPFYLAYVQLLEDSGIEIRENYELKQTSSSKVSYNPVDGLAFIADYAAGDVPAYEIKLYGGTYAETHSDQLLSLFIWFFGDNVLEVNADGYENAQNTLSELFGSTEKNDDGEQEAHIKYEKADFTLRDSWGDYILRAQFSD